MRSMVEGEENVTHNYDFFERELDPEFNVMNHYLPMPKLHPTHGSLNLKEINALSLINKRSIITDKKRAKLFKNKSLSTSEERVKLFRDELEKLRISFVNDSITFVIDRANIIQDTLSQINTTDDFDFHKELKIFFIDEEAQDAGGILREWISYLGKKLQYYFSNSPSHLQTDL